MKKTLKSKKIWVAAAVIVIGVAGTLSWLAAGAEVETEKAFLGTVEKTIKETGTIQSESQVIVYAKAGGQITDVAVTEGDAVTEGQQLLSKDASGVDMNVSGLQAQLSGAQAAYRQAKELADKNATLYAEGAISYEVYRQSQTAAAQTKAQADSLRYSMGSASEAGELGGVSAPIGGVVTSVFVKQGESVAAGAQLFEIANLDDLYLEVQLISEDADQIAPGNRVTVYNRDSGFCDQEATVRKVHLSAQEVISELGISQKRVKVEIALSKPGGLRLGSDMTAEIIAAEKNNALCVSKDAIFEMNQKEYVYTAENKKAVLKEVETGLTGKDYTEIIKGLEEGAAVILSPGDDIGQGTRIKVK